MLMWIVWIAAGLVGLVVLMMLVLALLGSRLPEEHVASSAVRLGASPDTVWSVVADGEGYPQWADGISKVERLPDRDGLPVFRGVMGRNGFVLTTVRSEPPRLLEHTIADDRGPFSGRWVYQIEAESGGCRLRLTEYGRIRGAIPRAMMKHVFGTHMFLEKHLRALARKFGEAKPSIERVPPPPGVAATA